MHEKEYTGTKVLVRGVCDCCGKRTKRSIDLLVDTFWAIATEPGIGQRLARDEGWWVFKDKYVCKDCIKNEDKFPIEENQAIYLLLCGNILKNQAGTIMRWNEACKRFEFRDGSEWVFPKLPPGVNVCIVPVGTWRIVCPEELEDKQ